MKNRPSRSPWAKIELPLLCALALGTAPLAAQTLESAYRKEGSVTREAFGPITEKFQESSAVFFDKNRAVEYGVVISPEGQILVKASELDEIESPSVRVGKRNYGSYQVLATSSAWDVALVKIDAEDLVPVDFANYVPDHGTIVISNAGSGRFKRRAQMGVISANAREVGEGRLAVLGVTLAINEGEEVLRVAKVHAKSGAKAAGVEESDIVLSVDSKAVATVKEFMAALEGKGVGEKVTLELIREPEVLEVEDPFAWDPATPQGDNLSKEVELFERQEVFEEVFTRNDSMSGEFSKRRTNFPLVLQHDTSLANRTTGGPLLDLDGQCVGMNIAYVSRECSYAIPSKELQELVIELREMANNP